MKVFIHKSFLEKRFHAPLWFQWKAVTCEPHAPKFWRVTPENLLFTHDISSTTATFSSLVCNYVFAAAVRYNPAAVLRRYKQQVTGIKAEDNHTVTK